MFTIFTDLVKVKKNPTFWAVPRTVMEGNGDTSSLDPGDSQGFPLFVGILSTSFLAMGHEGNAISPVGHTYQKNLGGYNTPLLDQK